MPSFTIYVTGNAEWFYATLNAVAMFFNDGDFIWEVALMGALFAIITGAWFYIQRNIGSGVLKTHTWVEHAVMMALALGLAFVPTRVTIQDIYGEMGVTPVDNVPLIVSLPASIFSGISFEVFRAVDTSFQATSGSYMSVTDEGFASPLKLLFAMRGGLEKTSGDLAASFRYYLVDCTKNSAINARGVATSPDLFDYLIANGRDTGLTRTLIDAGGPTGGLTSLSEPVPVSCAQAKVLLQQRFDVFETGGGAGNSDVDRLINYNVRESNKGTGGGAVGYTYANYENAFNHLLGFTGQSAQQFMRTALVRNLVNDTYRCANSAYSEAAFTNCTQIQSDALEAYKVDAASGASLFTKTMFPAMTLLQLMFFAFGIIVFLYGLLRGAGVVMYLAKYCVFGLWVFSWLPFVAVINAFIQWMVEDKIQQLPAAGLTSENYATYMYDVLSTNLATASDMLAATPLLTLGILTGSAYAIAGVANRLSARDYTDESQAAPRTGAVQPMVQTTAMHQSNVRTGVQAADYTPIEYRYDERNGESIKSAERYSEQKDYGLISSFMNAQQSLVTSQSGQTFANSEYAGVDTSGQKLSQHMYDSLIQRARSQGYSLEDVNTAMAKVQGNAGVDFSVIGLGGGVDVSGGFKSGGVSDSNVKDLMSSARQAGVSYVLSNANGLRDTITTLGGVVGSDTHQTLSKFEESLKEQETAQSVYENVSELSRGIGGSRSIRSDQFAAIIERGDNGQGFNFTEPVHHRYQEYERKYGVDTMRAATLLQHNYITQGGATSLYGSDTMAQLEAMARMDQDGANFKNDMVGVATATAGVGTDYDRNAGLAERARSMGPVTDGVGRVGTGGLPRATGIRAHSDQTGRLAQLDGGQQQNAQGYFDNNEKLQDRFDKRGGTQTVGNYEEGKHAAAREQTQNAGEFGGNLAPGVGDFVSWQSDRVTGRGLGGQDPSTISGPAYQEARQAQERRELAKKEGVVSVDMKGTLDDPGIITRSNPRGKSEE